MPTASKPSAPSTAHDFVVLCTDDRGHVAAFGPARPQDDADAVALRLRSWGLSATVACGTVRAGKFIPAEVTS